MEFDHKYLRPSKKFPHRLRTSMKKLQVANEAEGSRNGSINEKLYGAQPSQSRRWLKNYQKIKKFAEKSSTRVTAHHGQKL